MRLIYRFDKRKNVSCPTPIEKKKQKTKIKQNSLGTTDFDWNMFTWNRLTIIDLNRWWLIPELEIENKLKTRISDKPIQFRICDMDRWYFPKIDRFFYQVFCNFGAFELEKIK